MRRSGPCGRCPGCLGRKVVAVVPTRGPGGTRQLTVQVMSPGGGRGGGAVGAMGGTATGGPPLIARHVEGIENVSDEEFAQALHAYMSASRTSPHTSSSGRSVAPVSSSSSHQSWGTWLKNTASAWLWGTSGSSFPGTANANTSGGASGSGRYNVVETEVSAQIEKMFLEAKNEAASSSAVVSTPEPTPSAQPIGDRHVSAAAVSSRPRHVEEPMKTTVPDRSSYRDPISRKTGTSNSYQKRSYSKAPSSASVGAPKPSASVPVNPINSGISSVTKTPSNNQSGASDGKSSVRPSSSNLSQSYSPAASVRSPKQIDLFSSDINASINRESGEVASINPNKGSLAASKSSMSPATSSQAQQLDLFNQYFSSSIVTLNLNKGTGPQFRGVRKPHIYDDASKILGDGSFSIAFVQEIGAPTYPTWKLKLKRYAGYESNGGEAGLMWDPSFVKKLKTISESDRRRASYNSSYPADPKIVDRSCAVLLETQTHPPQQLLAISWHGPANRITDERKMATFVQLQKFALELRKLNGNENLPILIGGDFNLDLTGVSGHLLDEFKVIERLSERRQGKRSVDGFLFAGNVDLTGIRAVQHAGKMDHCPQNPILSFKNAFDGLWRLDC